MTEQNINTGMKSSANAEAEKLVTIRFFAGAAHASGTDKTQIVAQPEWTIKETVQAACPTDLSQLLAVSSYLLDGCLVDGAETVGQLEDFHTLDVLPPFAGG